MLIAEQGHTMCPQETHDQCMCTVVARLEAEGLADAVLYVAPDFDEPMYLK